MEIVKLEGMNLTEVASLLQLSRERAKVAIDEGIRTVRGVLVRLPAASLDSGPDVSATDLDAFIGAFEEHEPGRHPPIAVRRELLIESGYKCAVCRSDAPLEFHHIVDWASIKHHDARHMLAVCSNCHAKISRHGQPDFAAQKEIKRRLERYDSARIEAQRPAPTESRPTPLPVEEATRVANSVLGGDVVRALSYVEGSTGRLYVATVRQTSAKSFDPRVYILEQVGATYRTLWSSETLFAFTENRILDAEDIDGDGRYEIMFSDRARGTHQDSHYLHLYFPARKLMFSVSENSNPSALSDPATPMVHFSPEPSEEVRDAILDAATRRGFLQLTADDLQRPDAALRRWFRDNGPTPNGPVSVHEYDGKPTWGSSVHQELAIGDAVWLAYFKGPLIRYDRACDRHYVAYAPADRYDWPKALAWDGESLWFGIHMTPVLIRFHEPSKTLQRIPFGGDNGMPVIDSLEYDAASGELVVNGAVRLRIRNLPPLPRF